MSDNIPLDIQMQIIKKVSDVKSLVQFRSVSKQWKSYIDSAEFIKGYGAHHTHPNRLILSYISKYIDAEAKYFCLFDDDIETFKAQKQKFVRPPLFIHYYLSYVVGACRGLLCLYGDHRVYKTRMVVIWNPSIRKSLGIVVPWSYDPWILYGFGVCPVTSDPTVVKLVCADKMPWHVEVFTLSSGVWNVIPSANLPRQSVKFNKSTQVVIDRFIYWAASEETFTDDGKSTRNHMLVSFDLVTKEFRVVDLPNSLTNELVSCVSVCKLTGSLVVSGYIQVEGGVCYGVWVMEHDSSFRKLFTFRARVFKMVGFSKNGEPIFEIEKGDGRSTTLNVYDPCSQQIKNLGISGAENSFFMGSYKESLLLLDHSDSRIY